MRKVAFFGIPGHSRYHYAEGLNYSDGMPRRSGAALETALELYGETGNKGNMIHGEAPARMFQFDREHSCYVSARSLIVQLGWTPEQVAEELSRKFDLVVFSTANLIRPKTNPGGTARILDALTVDFAVLGMGMQEPLPPSTDLLHGDLVDLLRVCNEKARVFGVRGEKTEGWLRSVGFGNARALGCPSLYVYPRNILRIEVPEPSRIRTAVTGGYISARIPRSKVLVDLFEGIEAHYVMQDEIFELKDRLREYAGDEDLYNDVTGELDRSAMNGVLEEIHYRALPFVSYRWFQDPNAWRMFASSCDCYLGDRLHGGIVALQSGLPSIFISEDQRVDEVADFVQLPRVSSRDIKGMKAREVIGDVLTRERIERFRSAYFDRWGNFRDVFKELELPMADSPVSALPVSAPGPAHKRSLKTRLKRLAARIGC